MTKHKSSQKPPRGPFLLPTLLVVVLLVTSYVADKYEWGPRYLGWGEAGDVPVAVQPPDEIDLPEIALPPVVAGAAPTDRLRPAAVRQALRGPLQKKVLGPHVAAAVAPLQGNPTIGMGANPVVTPASTLKLLTATTALSVLGPEETFTTRVLSEAPAQNNKPATLTLVGGGDPFLARKPIPKNDSETYPERGDIRTLARDAAAELKAQGSQRVRVTYDDSLFAGPAASPQWRADYIPDSVVTPITSLWVDQGRFPDSFARVDDPAAAAGTEFAQELRKAGLKVVGNVRDRPASASATEVAAMESASVAEIVERTLDVSDNEAAEVLLRQSSLGAGGDGSFSSGVETVETTLARLGVGLDDARIFDGSGLSRKNRVSVQTIVQTLQVAASPQHPELRPVVTGLPVAGFTGSLSSRFDTSVPSGPGRVRAKTGTLTGVHGLAGIVIDGTGSPLVVVAVADRVRKPDNLKARVAIDNTVARISDCACSADRG